jgi:hypothetical protein
MSATSGHLALVFACDSRLSLPMTEQRRCWAAISDHPTVPGVTVVDPAASAIGNIH